MTLDPVTVDRLAIILPLLGSDKSGEVVAAAAAMSRILEAARADWHDVAAALTAPAAPVPPPPAGGVAEDCLYCLRAAVAWTYQEELFLSELPRFGSCG